MLRVSAGGCGQSLPGVSAGSRVACMYSRAFCDRALVCCCAAVFLGDHTVLASNQPMLTVNAHDPEEAREALSVLRWTI